MATKRTDLAVNPKKYFTAVARRVTLSNDAIEKLDNTAKKLLVQKNDLANNMILKSIAQLENELFVEKYKGKITNRTVYNKLIAITAVLQKITNLLGEPTTLSQRSIVKASNGEDVTDAENIPTDARKPTQAMLYDATERKEMYEFLKEVIEKRMLIKLINVFEKLGVKSSKEIETLSYASLASVRNIGIHTCRYLREALKKKNITLRDDEIFFICYDKFTKASYKEQTKEK